MTPPPGSRWARELPGLAGFLAGPTASGKSALAVALALDRGWALVSGDSMQVYRGMETGTGAITPAEARGVPHHLVGVCDPTEDFHAARFVEAATRAITQEWEANGRRSLVVGGTGLWIEALREGLHEGAGRDEAIRGAHEDFARQHGPGALHARLAAADPESAARLHPSDHVRVSRALEVLELTGRTLSDWLAEDRRRRASLGPLPPLVVLDPPRPELAERISARVDSMLAAGWLEEARRLHALGLPERSPARKALGYRQLFLVIEGAQTLEQAAERIKAETRQFSRRQRSWFRARKDVQWLWPAEAGAALELLGA